VIRRNKDQTSYLVRSGALDVDRIGPGGKLLVSTPRRLLTPFNGKKAAGIAPAE
jgi:hypothetical protein